MPFSLASLTTTSASSLPNHRSLRYAGDDRGIALATFPERDRDTMIAFYGFLRDLERVLDETTPEDDDDRLRALLVSRDPAALMARVRMLGQDDGLPPGAAEALHDVRGGAATLVFVRAAKFRTAASTPEVRRTLAVHVRDHMKMMRNVVPDLDPDARARDTSPLPHRLADLADALRRWSDGADSSGSRVDVDAPEDATIAESCVECSAVDRIVYNLVNNGIRHAPDGRVHVRFVVTHDDLRGVVTNAVTASHSALLRERLTADATTLFGSFSTSGSGRGLGIVADLVSRAYGIGDLRSLVDAGYVGTTVEADTFGAWFHWPRAGA
ncbi:MAG: hypothetical protein U0169_24945 [Polyangiaceae bacterium]